MTLRKKSIIIIIMASLLIISLVNAASRLILVKNLSDLEEKYTIKDTQRAYGAILTQQNNLFALVKDYAIWNDTYAFANDLNANYIKSNLIPTTFTNQNINFFILTDNTGRITAAFGHDLVNDISQPVSPDFLNLISQTTLFQNPGLKTGSAGFFIVKDKLILLAYHAILTSNSAGPARGLLIVGRYLDADFSTKLSTITQLTLQVSPNLNQKAELTDAKHISGFEPQMFIKFLDNKTISGYVIFQDILGKPSLLLQTKMERDIFNQGYSTILFFITIVFLGSVFFLISAIYLLDSQVTSRITRLSQSIAEIRLSGTLADRVPVKGVDEIASMANELNQMLGSLEVADYQIRHAKDEMEKLVEERTATLIQVNQDLLHEIDERQLGQNALFDAYTKIQLIISSISSIMVSVDSNGLVTLWNDVAARLLGLSANEVIGSNFYTLPINWDWERITRETASCIQDNKKTRMDDIFLGNMIDNPKILGITLTPLILKEETSRGFLLIGSDITERRLLEEQIGRSNKMQAIGEMAAGVAHEINTPTQLVGSNLRFLRQQLEPVLDYLDNTNHIIQAIKNGTSNPGMAISMEKKAAAAHLNYFRQEAPLAIEQSLLGVDRISHIVNAMRFFSHPGHQKKEDANLNQIIQNALDLSRSEWKNVAEIQTDLDPNLPILQCLPIELSQVILNLIINAVHAIQDVPVFDQNSKGQIVITSHRLAEVLEVRITDNGTGIPHEIQTKIFDPFFTTKEVGRGTGQGLAIAYAVIVKKHGGCLEFESEPGRGTKFIIRLPRTETNE
ncbi:MAG: CHASE4 domain-containing protein [Chloroflexota bacterium]